MKNENHDIKLLVCILAAGESRRMGQPKQLLDWHGETLLNHTITQIQSLSCDNLVILGAYYEELFLILDNNIKVIRNLNWSAGIGSSIRLSIDYAIKKKYKAVCFTVCDNPNFNTKHYQQLIECYHLDKNKIVYTRYQDTFGTPIIFPECFFTNLLSINIEEGAKIVVKKNIANSNSIDIKSTYCDIDTMVQYKNALRKINKYTSLYG